MSIASLETQYSNLAFKSDGQLGLEQYKLTSSGRVSNGALQSGHVAGGM